MRNVFRVLATIYVVIPSALSSANADDISKTLATRITKECAGGWAAFNAATMSGMPQTTKDIAQQWLTYCGTIRSGQAFPEGTTDATPGQIRTAKTNLGAAAAAAGVYVPKTR